MRASEKYNLLFNSPISYISLFFTSNFVENKWTTIWDFLMNIQTWKTPPKNIWKYWDSNDFCWYKPEEIWKDIYLYESNFKVSDLALKDKKVTIFEENTILINCIWDIWRMWILKNKASSNQQITWLLFNEKVIPEYFFYYFLPKKNELISKSASITLPIINQRKLEELEFNLTNIETQKEFVRYMNYCLACYKNKDVPHLRDFDLPKWIFSFSEKVFNIYYWENNLKLISDKTLSYIKQLKQSILQEAIEWKLTKDWREANPSVEPASVLLEKIKKEKEELVKEKKLKKQEKLKEITEDEIPFQIPERWSWCRLGEIWISQTWTTPSTNDKSNFWNYIPFIKPADIQEIWINYFNEWLSEKWLSNWRIIKRNSILMVCIWGSIWKCNLTDRDVSCNQQINSITPIKNDNNFIYLTLKTYYFYNKVWELANWAATPIINKSKWDEISIPLPPLEEQKEIVKKVDELMKFFDDLEKQSLEAKDNAENLMKSVLSEVFSK